MATAVVGIVIAYDSGDIPFPNIHQPNLKKND